MTEQTTVLHLILSRLPAGNSITSIDDRIAIQKAVCLTQEAGLPLGYSFNWYVRGPYSPSLASDYYQLASSRQSTEASARGLTLADSALRAIDRVSAVSNVPSGVHLDRVRWLELLASIAFLRRRHRLNDAATRRKLEVSKPDLYPYYNQAVRSLSEAGFVLE